MDRREGEPARHVARDAARDGREAKQRLAELKGFEAVRRLAEEATQQLQALTQRQEQSEQLPP